MAWRRPGDKPLSELMMVSLLTHICVTPPQWVKRRDALPPNLTKPRSHEIRCYHDRIALKFDRYCGSAAAEMPVKFQIDRESINPNLAVSRHHNIFQQAVVLLLNTSGPRANHWLSCIFITILNTRFYKKCHRFFVDFQPTKDIIKMTAYPSWDVSVRCGVNVSILSTEYVLILVGFSVIL